MRTLLTIFFMTLAAQASAYDFGQTLKCKMVSEVIWSLKNGFKTAPESLLKERPLLWVNWRDDILSITPEGAYPEILYLEATTEDYGQIGAAVFKLEREPEISNVISKVIIEDPQCNRSETKLISILATDDSMMHSIVDCEC